jgi:hypothetical protein
MSLGPPVLACGFIVVIPYRLERALYVLSVRFHFSPMAAEGASEVERGLVLAVGPDFGLKPRD